MPGSDSRAEWCEGIDVMLFMAVVSVAASRRISGEGSGGCCDGKSIVASGWLAYTHAAFFRLQREHRGVCRSQRCLALAQESQDLRRLMRMSPTLGRHGAAVALCCESPKTRGKSSRVFAWNVWPAESNPLAGLKPLAPAAASGVTANVTVAAWLLQQSVQAPAPPNSLTAGSLGGARRFAHRAGCIED